MLERAVSGTSADWRYRHTVLALCTFAFFATMVARVVISPVVPDIVDAFDSSTTLVGLALTGMWAAYALMQFPSGVLADRYGERIVILAAVVLTGLGALLLAASPTFVAFALFAILLGGGAGLHYSVATTLLTGLFSNTGRAIGIHVSGGPLAGLLAPIAAAYVGVRFGWRYAVLIGFVVAVPIALLFAWRVRPTEPSRPKQPIRERFQTGPVLDLLSRPTIAYTTLLAFAASFAWQATASFLPTLLVVHHGRSIAVAGALFSLFFVVQAAFVPVVGSISDRVGRDRTFATTMAIAVVAFSVLAFVPGGSVPILAGGVVLCGIGMSWSPPLQDRFLHELTERERNAGFGLVRTVYMLLGALGSVVTGTLADLAGWAVAFGFLSVLLALALASMLVARLLGLDL